MLIINQIKKNIFFRRPMKKQITLLATISFITLLTSCTKIQVIDEKPRPVDTDLKIQADNVIKSETTLIEEPKEYVTKTKENTDKVKQYCLKMDDYFKKYNWGKSGCDDFSWNHVRNSHKGTPIVWYVFGDEERAQTVKMNTTLIMCGVHGDEITPVKFCFDLLHDLKKNPKLFKDQLVLIAPLVAPDSFFKNNPTRTNARGVDVNRNFPTKDWSDKANKLWKSRYGADIRRFPGKYALSEQETIFQVNLINRYNPQKVVSVHAPLTLLDYDGPSFAKDEGQGAKQLLIQMSDAAGKYKISNYPFFPGSLGNWAGNERRIPTYTLELPNSDWNKTDRYFKLFRTAIHHAIKHDLRVHVMDKKFSKSHDHSHDNIEQIID